MSLIIVGTDSTLCMKCTIMYNLGQGWGAGAGRSRVFWLFGAGAAWKKKSGPGAGAAKKLAGSSALR